MSTLLQYRYVIIPGGVAARAAKLNIDWTNYEAAMHFIGTQE
ncbi:hypothetical protein [Flavihumibacter petaseus]|nr:hypothetical protein [Flavihumibacter petaseus]